MIVGQRPSIASNRSEVLGGVRQPSVRSYGRRQAAVPGESAMGGSQDSPGRHLQRSRTKSTKVRTLDDT